MQIHIHIRFIYLSKKETHAERLPVIYQGQLTDCVKNDSMVNNICISLYKAIY